LAKAVSLLEPVVEKETNRYTLGRAQRLLIGLRIDEGKKEAARALLETFREQGARDPNHLRQVARLLLRRFRDPAAAAATLKEAHGLPGGRTFWVGLDLANALRKAGEAKEAEEIAMASMRDVGGAMGARYVSSFFRDCGKVGRYETFLKELLERTKDPKERMEIHLLRADALLHRKKPEPEKALAALQKAEGAADEAGLSRYERERIWAQKCLVANNYLNDPATQEKYNNRLLGLRPRHENYRLWRAIALARFGESRDAAWEAFRKIPPRRNLAYNRACFLSNMGKSDEAIALLRSAIEAIEDVEARNRQRLWAAADDEFRALRDLPAFKAIVKLEDE
jgi:tetratricopeptide (TPR) repeat protein